MIHQFFIKYQIHADIEYEDYDNAIWDKEEQCWLCLENVNLSNNFETDYSEILVGLNLSTGEFEVLSELNEINIEFNIDEPIDETNNEGIDENSKT